MNAGWVMRRVTPNEYPQLWHRIKKQSNGYYICACGLKVGIAGSSFKNYVPAGACAKCLRFIANPRSTEGAQTQSHPAEGEGNAAQRPNESEEE